MIDIRQIQASEWQKYRDVRLRALRDAPDAFGSTYAIESAKTDAAWQHQIETALSSHSDYPLFALIQEDVCGLVWCKLSAAEPDTAHIYQMWVDPAVRGSGAGHALLDCAVILAAIHAGVTGERYTATLARLEALFDASYAINRSRRSGRAPALGRYAGDKYYSGGAYYLSTLGAAEFCWHAARHYTLDRRQFGLEGLEQHAAQRRDRNEQDHHQPAPLQRRAEQAAIAGIQCIEEALNHHEGCSVLFFMPQQQRAHHRRQGQGDETGHQHGAGQRQCKLDEQLAGSAGHEGHRRIHHRQRQRHRDNGKADFTRPLLRRLQPWHAFLDMTENIFKNDNRVVHHETNRQHQR